MGRVVIDRSFRGSDAVKVAPFHLPTLLRQQRITQVRTLSLQDLRQTPNGLETTLRMGEGVVVVGAETDEDLARTAAVCMTQTSGPLLAGSTGLAMPVAINWPSVCHASSKNKLAKAS